MMERILLAVLCLAGWNICTGLVRQYHYVAESKNWTEAHNYCKNIYTDLATVENLEDVNRLRKTVASSGYNSEVWIGLFTRIQWRWSNGYTGSGAEYRKWDNIADNEPDFASFDQFCVLIASNGLWWDDFCTYKYNFVCYNGSQLHPEFFFVPEEKDWPSAQRYCRENFVDLATVRNDTENQLITNLVPSGYAWIGLSRDPNMQWSDKSGFSFKYYSPQTISIDSMSMMCGLAALDESGKWTIKSCKIKLPFVCYSIPPPGTVVRRVVKLEIKLDDPSLDLNDPVVKADMLKKLQDRLKKNGGSGATLKWREQPDGKVFHKKGKRSQKTSREKTEL